MTETNRLLALVPLEVPCAPCSTMIGSNMLPQISDDAINCCCQLVQWTWSDKRLTLPLNNPLYQSTHDTEHRIPTPPLPQPGHKRGYKSLFIWLAFVTTVSFLPGPLYGHIPYKCPQTACLGRLVHLMFEHRNSQCFGV